MPLNVVFQPSSGKSIRIAKIGALHEVLLPAFRAALEGGGGALAIGSAATLGSRGGGGGAGVGGVVAVSMAADRGSKALVDWVLVSLLQRRGEEGRKG